MLFIVIVLVQVFYQGGFARLYAVYIILRIIIILKI